MSNNIMMPTGHKILNILKETKAAAGYAVDDTIYWISISSGGKG